jgi:hypothetical protein
MSEKEPDAVKEKNDPSSFGDTKMEDKKGRYEDSIGRKSSYME